MKPFDAKFRGEIFAACDTDEERRLIELRFGVSESWLRRIQQQRRETGQIAARPDIYLRELQAELKRELGEKASLGTICAACRELDQSRKKDADRQRAGSA